MNVWLWLPAIVLSFTPALSFADTMFPPPLNSALRVRLRATVVTPVGDTLDARRPLLGFLESIHGDSLSLRVRPEGLRGTLVRPLPRSPDEDFRRTEDIPLAALESLHYREGQVSKGRSIFHKARGGFLGGFVGGAIFGLITGVNESKDDFIYIGPWWGMALGGTFFGVIGGGGGTLVGALSPPEERWARVRLPNP